MTSDLVASPPAVRGAEGHLVADRPGDVDQRTELARLLQVAAAIEHSLMVQYLYAAYSADVVIAAGQFPDAALWQQQLLTVAREEMGHLMTVQNALRLIGAEPNWKREDIPWDGAVLPVPDGVRAVHVHRHREVRLRRDGSLDRPGTATGAEGLASAQAMGSAAEEDRRRRP